MKKILYESVIKNIHADSGQVTSSSGNALNISPTLSPEQGHNPGELLAFSWATCLEATMRYVFERRGLNVKSQTEVKFSMCVDDHPPRGYKFQYEAILYMSLADEALRLDILNETHQRCPISKLLKDHAISLIHKELKSTSL